MVSWVDVLKEHCAREWETNGTVLMLSRVPTILKNAGIDVGELLQGRKLRPFLQAEGDGAFQLIQSERNSLLWGLAPNDAALTAPFDRYFRRASGPKATRFAAAAWRAFTTPIPAERRRWLFDDPAVHFRDVEGELELEHGFEIERRFIVEHDEQSDVDTALVLARIAAWAAEVGVDPSRFALGQKKAPLPRPERASGGEGSALDQLIAILLPTELSRISIPLDVIARLRATKGAAGK